RREDGCGTAQGRSSADLRPPPKPAARSRLIIGDFGPSDSARAAARGWRLRRAGAARHAARLRFSGPVLGRRPSALFALEGAALSPVNHPLIERLAPSHVEVVLQRVDEAEVDEIRSFVGKKKEPRWLWHAIDRRTGQVLAYVFGRRKDEV